MHIPDAFIPLWQGGIYWIIALIALSISIKWANKEMSQDRIPIIAVLCSRHICDPEF